MLPRSLRLSRQGFEQARGLKRAASAHFSLSYGQNPKDFGVGVVISKKVVSGAVGRHLLKRRIMAVLKPNARPGLVLIVHARPQAGDLPFPELSHELNTLIGSILPTQIN